MTGAWCSHATALRLNCPSTASASMRPRVVQPVANCRARRDAITLCMQEPLSVELTDAWGSHPASTGLAVRLMSASMGGQPGLSDVQGSQKGQAFEFSWAGAFSSAGVAQ